DADPPKIPDAWLTNAPSADDRAGFLKMMAQKAGDASRRAREFRLKYADHTKAFEGRIREFRQAAVAVYFGNTNLGLTLNDLKRVNQADRELKEDMRYLMLSSVSDRLYYLSQAFPGLVSLDQLDEQARILRNEFPSLAESYDPLLSAAQARFLNDELDKASALARELISGSAPDSVKESAANLLKMMERAGKPVSIQFTDLNGNDVSLAKLRGKVVLVDFWATWCTLCMEEMPRVVEVYQDLRAKGFEVVGLNFDSDRAVVGKALVKEKMTWPQFFDGNGWENKFGKEFDIVALPVMWLIDKQGVLREVNARRDLRRKVERLLAE
ncbi:MAG: redoxin family protein, partial [Opitutaceae bacterium]|nr:redoxin family protein [Verrucomicrobiales bacterium]